MHFFFLKKKTNKFENFSFYFHVLIMLRTLKILSTHHITHLSQNGAFGRTVA